MERAIKIGSSAVLIGSILVVALIAFQSGFLAGKVLPSLYFEEIEQGYYCGIKARVNYVIDDLETWETLWTDIHNTSTGTPELPYVNFTSEVIIAAFLGEFATGGFVANITRIAVSGNGITVYIREQHPGDNCGLTMALTQPYNIVKASVESVQSVEFVYNLVIHNCP